MSGAKIILDTNVASYLMRGGTLAETCLPHVQGKLLAVAFITVGEMYYGAEKAKWGTTRQTKLEGELRKLVIIPYDHEIARCYGRLVAQRQHVGAPIAPNDAWIAACAVRHAIPLLTHNAKHFRGISGLTVITETKEDEGSKRA
jgi:tRNA(fMet)-specific endonuclease VapC